MLKITPEQMRTLDASAQGKFHAQVLALLRQQLPEQTRLMDDVILLDRISSMQRAANVLGIKTQGGFLRFVFLNLLVGPDFQQLPAVQKYLQRPELDGDQKMRLLMNLILPAQAGQG